ncbi:MAG: hypothetical protein Unbinned579contig1003_28 [Prokaryotic dsDNA virus sp.]|nr:MAG: hypothetical protein Unbinned579contig1003_28 [Prokaryotic dsDNA virus sp.]|tara:strand:+ start:24361 stop:24954 length:594 start_codon:yes stop_codon:yes gene_type:complete
MQKFKNIERYLESFGRSVINKAKGNLKRRGKGNGKLESSLRSEVKKGNKGYEVQFFMEPYGAFVDKGVQGIGGSFKSESQGGKSKYAGKSFSGKQQYLNYKGQNKNSPFKFGSGKSPGSIYKGIGSFIKKKGLQPRNEKGQYQTTLGLKIAMVKVLWIKGIKGISFFQKPLSLGIKTFKKDYTEALEKDIIAMLKFN